MGNRSKLASGCKRLKSKRRFRARLRLSNMALAAWIVPNERTVWTVRVGDARAGHGDCGHRWRKKQSRGTRPDLGDIVAERAVWRVTRKHGIAIGIAHVVGGTK